MQAINSQPRCAAVIFDLDGTLANTLPTVVRIFNQCLRARTGRAWKLEELMPYFGPPEDVILQRLFPQATNCAAVIEEFYQLSHADGGGITPFAGVREMLAELRRSGIKLGVYSGASTRAARIRIAHASLLEFFDEVVGGDQVSNYKPHPEGLLKLIERFQVAPQTTVYVGDMVADVAVGRGAGATTVAVTWGAGTREDLVAAEPDHLIDDPRLLHHIINSN